MSTFFQVIGIMVVSIILLIILGYFGLKLYFRFKFGKHLAKALEHGPLAQPARIHLELIAADEIDDVEFHQQVEKLQRLAFNPIGYYLIPELDNTCLFAATNDEKDITVAVYAHIVGCFYDVLAQTSDAFNITYSTAPAGDGLDYPPDEEKYFLPIETPLEEAIGLLETRTDNLRKPMEGSFNEFFEEAYTKEMDWRLERGMTEREVLNLAEKNGEQYSPEQIQTALNDQNYLYSLELDTLVIDAFLDSNQVTAKQWNTYQNGTLVIHKNTPLEDLQDSLHWYVDDLETRKILQPVIEKAEDCWQLMQKLNPLLPSSHQFDLIGSLDSPIPAKLFYNKHFQ